MGLFHKKPRTIEEMEAELKAARLKREAQEALAKQHAEAREKAIAAVPVPPPPSPVPEPPQKKGGLLGRVEGMEDKLEALVGMNEKQKQRAFKMRLPAKVKRKVKKAWLRNKILVFYLRSDKNLLPLVGEMQANGNVKIGEKYHDASEGYVYFWKGKVPSLVIPEWDENPIGTKQYVDAVKEGRLTNHQPVTIRAIKLVQQGGEKKRLNSGAIIWIAIIAIIAGYIFFGNTGG